MCVYLILFRLASFFSQLSLFIPLQNVSYLFSNRGGVCVAKLFVYFICYGINYDFSSIFSLQFAVYIFPLLFFSFNNLDSLCPFVILLSNPISKARLLFLLAVILSCFIPFFDYSKDKHRGYIIGFDVS